MRHVHFVAVLLLIGPATAVRADDAPEPVGALVGRWVRPSLKYDGKTYAPLTLSKDGKDVVCPELHFYVQEKKAKLAVGGTPPTVYWNPGPTVYDLVVPEGAKRVVLAIVVPHQGLKRQVQFEYTLEKDTLTIICREKVLAGPWLGDYNISGTWVRPKKGYLH